MKNTKKAEAGIGELVLFIALILVAAIAAGVLISTASALQAKSLETGSQARTQVSTAVEIINAWALNGSTGTVRQFYFKVKLAPGSEPIALNESYVFVDSETNDRQVLRYNSTTSNCSTPTTITTTTFGITKRLGYANPGYLQDGDIIDLCFNTTYAVMPNQDLRIGFVPRVGSQAAFSTTIPSVVSTLRVDLFP
jgi:archaellin